MSRVNGTNEGTVPAAPAVLASQTMKCKIVPTSHANFSRTVAEIGTLGAAEGSRKMVDAGLAETVPTCTAS